MGWGLTIRYHPGVLLVRARRRLAPTDSFSGTNSLLPVSIVLKKASAY